MKTIFQITLMLLILNGFLSCSKDDRQELVPNNQPPTQVLLISPSPEAQNIDVKPTFSWDAAIDPEGDQITYEIYADNTAIPSTLIGMTTETNFESNERLRLSENYNWRVIAKDDDGETASDIESFGTRTAITSIATNSAAFGDRGAHTTVVFQDKVWLIGGRLGNGSTTDMNDVWNSDDGVNWTLVTANANFSPRYRHSSVVFDNKIWVLGGIIGTELTDQIWNSSDGINWTLVGSNTSLNFVDSRIIVFENKLWLIDNAVWFSEDGVVWSLAYSNTNIDGSPVIFNNKIVVTNVDDSEVHISEDGFIWETISNNINELLENTLGINEEMVIFDHKIWALGHFDTKIIYSADGFNWSIIDQFPVFPFLFDYTFEEKDNKLWVIGGYTSGSNNAQSSVYFID